MYVCNSQLLLDSSHISQPYFVILVVHVSHVDIHDTGQIKFDQRKVSKGEGLGTDCLTDYS